MAQLLTASYYISTIIFTSKITGLAADFKHPQKTIITTQSPFRLVIQHNRLLVAYKQAYIILKCIYENDLPKVNTCVTVSVVTITGWCLVGGGHVVIWFWTIVAVEELAANSILTDKISYFRF